MPFSNRSICTALERGGGDRIQEDDVGLAGHGPLQQVVAARLDDAVARASSGRR
jgi:hypothetical protein